MSNFRLDDFETHLRQSGLLDEQQINDLLSKEFSDARYLAKHLISTGQLTEWQAKSLLAGKSHLRIGNYLLRDRIERNELGQRFLAKHSKLARMVVLQFLPSAFTSESPHFGSFIRTANQLAKIDHPNLAHVYDVGAEQGAYFVVQEHVSGIPICEVDLKSLSKLDALRYIEEMASAVKFLHEQTIEHGTISERNVWVNDHGQIQIIDLIANELNKSLLTADDSAGIKHREFGLIDRVGIQGICGDIIEGVFGRNADTQMLNAIVQLPRSEAALDQLIQLAGESQRAHGEFEAFGLSGLLGEKDSQPVDSESDRANRSKHDSKPGPGSGANQKLAASTGVGQQTEASSPREDPTTQDRRGNPALMMTIGSVLAMLVIGGVSYVVWNIVGKGTSEQIADVVKAPVDTAGPKKRVAFEDLAIEEGGVKNSSLATPSNSRAPEKTPADTVEKDAAGELNKTTVEMAADVRVQEPADEKPSDPTGQKPDPFSVPDTHGAPNDAPTDQEPSTASGAQPAPNSPVPVTANKLDELPGQFDLRPSSTVAAQTIGAISLAPDVKLSLELLTSTDLSGKGKNFFKLASVEGQANQWVVSHGKRDTELAQVGRFSVVGQSIQFQWDSGLAEDGYHNYLVNCIVKLSAGDASKLVALRTPVVFDEIHLDEKEFSNKGSLVLDWMPNPDAIRFEPGVLDEKKWPKAQWVNAFQLDRQPAFIFFGDPAAKQAVWLALSTEIKSRFEFRLDMLAQQGLEVVSVKPRKLNEMMGVLTAQYEQLVVAADQASQLATIAPDGQKTKTREAADKIRKQKEEFQAFRTMALEQIGTVEGLLNEPIPCRLSYEFDGQLVVIATSSNFVTPVPRDPDPGEKAE